MVIATTMVEVMGWGPRVSDAVARLEQAFYVLIVGGLLLVFSVALIAVVTAYRR